jgi:hypothetical protein
MVDAVRPTGTFRALKKLMGFFGPGGPRQPVSVTVLAAVLF